MRYDGADQGCLVQDHEELRGNLIDQLNILGGLLPANIRTAIREASGLRQQDAPDDPLAALRELAVNALMHRNAVTVENFDRRNDYRNPALAAAMKDLGYVNRFGRGIGLVRSTPAANGNPPAEFAIEPTYWGVTVKAAE